MDDLIKRSDAINIVVSALNAEIPFAIVPTLIQGLPSADSDCKPGKELIEVCKNDTPTKHAR